MLHLSDEIRKKEIRLHVWDRAGCAVCTHAYLHTEIRIIAHRNKEKPLCYPCIECIIVLNPMDAQIVGQDETRAHSDSSPLATRAHSPQPHGKSSHTTALRSLGLLQELQEYVAGLQNTAAEQQRQLNQLRGERREAQRVARRAGCSSSTLPPPRSTPPWQQSASHFAASEISDLPPRLRALVEDNKVC